MGKEEMKQYIGQQVEAIRSELMEISQYIFQNPEVAHTEHKDVYKRQDFELGKIGKYTGDLALFAYIVYHLLRLRRLRIAHCLAAFFQDACFVRCNIGQRAP